MATKSPLHGATRGLLVIMLLLITGCVTNPYTNRSQLIMITLGEEKMMGLQAFNHIVQDGLTQNAIVTDHRIVGPITRIADRIIDAALHSRYSEVARQFDWETVVLNSQEANAMCASGGKIIVMTGILPIAKNAAGLAAVLGHEVTHALARHGAERVSQGRLADAALTGIGTALQSELSPEGLNLAMQAMGMATDVGILKPFSREHESEADYIGVLLAAQAGYDPTEAIRVWERMSAASAAQPPEFLSTHPSHGTRIQQLEQWMPEALSIYNSVPHANH
jgi:predicted Zn-dependent protease